MTDEDDYARFEEYIEDDEPDFIINYGVKTYAELPITKRDDYFLEKFFKNTSGYEQSASELRTGYDAYLEGNVHKDEEVIHFMRRGKNIHVVRSVSTGKILRWIK